MATAGASERHRRRVLRRDSDDPLRDMLGAGNATLLAGFATGLHRDLAAVQAALDLPWTTNSAEGQINRLKMIKRTMYGPAGFALLRARLRHGLRRTRGGLSPHPSADVAKERPALLQTLAEARGGALPGCCCGHAAFRFSLPLIIWTTSAKADAPSPKARSTMRASVGCVQEELRSIS